MCIDPIDQYRGPPDWCSFSRPIWPREVVNIAKIALAVKESTRVAKLDFGRVSSISDVVAMFEERAAMSFQRFSLENYMQTHLAWGLSLIAAGQPAEGRQHLELFCVRFSIDQNDRMLQQALLAAENTRHNK